MLLELAIWKAKLGCQFSQNTDESKMQSRVESLSVVPIIVPNVVSFLGWNDFNGGQRRRKRPRYESRRWRRLGDRPRSGII